MPQPPPVRVGGRDIVKNYSLSKSNTLTKSRLNVFNREVDPGFRKKAKSADRANANMTTTLTAMLALGMCVTVRAVT